MARALKRHGITQRQIAAEASKTARFGTMSIPTVCNVLSGRLKSKNVIRTAKRLLAEAKNGTTTINTTTGGGES